MYVIKPLHSKIVKQIPTLAELMSERPTAQAYIALDGVESVGFMLLERHRIVHLYVIPEARRAGVATELVNHARYLSSAELHAPVSSSNRSAQAFFTKIGFTLFGRHFDGPSEGLLFVDRKLPESPGHDINETALSDVAQSVLDKVCVVEAAPVYL